MSAATPRNISTSHQLATLYRVQLQHMLRTRKTIALFTVQLIPVIIGLIMAIRTDTDGLVFFRDIISMVTFPFLVPLAALFYGGPAIVEEMEGRTLTYLTLRPISRPALYLGKVLAGITVAAAQVIIPMVLLFIVCVAKSSDFGATLGSLAQLSGAAALGVVTYSLIFAMLGAVFATSMLPSILYFVFFEMMLAVLPVLELASVRYYIRTLAGLNAGERLGPLEGLILDQPIVFSWWVGALILSLLSAVAATAGALTFKEKQYYV
jgi:ABC-type transport system involved in multi-copper enzyme maturation permease subunit